MSTYFLLLTLSLGSVFFLKKLIFVFSKDALNWSSDNLYKRIPFLFYNPKTCIMFFTKIFSSTTVFNIDNNQKCFLSSKSSYYNDFWRSCDTEDWSNDAENTAAHHSNKLHCKILKEFYIVINHINKLHFTAF